jgi:hypothetical protein
MYVRSSEGRAGGRASGVGTIAVERGVSSLFLERGD